jgi:hypothetical protein
MEKKTRRNIRFRNQADMTSDDDDDDDDHWHYSPDGRKPPLIRFRSLSQCE